MEEKSDKIEMPEKNKGIENIRNGFSECPINPNSGRKQNWHLIIPLVFITVASIYFFFGKDGTNEMLGDSEIFNFPDNKETSQTLEESSSMKKSKNPDWWLSSGALMKNEKGEFSTNIGNLSENNPWRKLYAKNNPKDTNNGYQPQNIFRLVTKCRYENISQEVYFKISATNLSQSENRTNSNGIFLFNRYSDSDNLYYAGIRVDGNAIIKKKMEGKYYTMGEKAIFKNGKKYDRLSNPNLIPQNKWIGIKSEIENQGKNVVVKIFIDEEGLGNWKLALEKKDNGEKYGNSPFTHKGHSGIRGDFMDLVFRNYSIKEIR